MQLVRFRKIQQMETLLKAGLTQRSMQTLLQNLLLAQQMEVMLDYKLMAERPVLLQQTRAAPEPRRQQQRGHRQQHLVRH